MPSWKGRGFRERSEDPNVKRERVYGRECDTCSRQTTLVSVVENRTRPWRKIRMCARCVAALYHATWGEP